MTAYARRDGRRRAVPGLLAVLMLLGRTAQAPCGQSIVEGVTLDEATGAPIGGAYVALSLEDRVTVVAAVVTSAQGRFRIRGPEPGRYFVFATHIGYGRLTHGPVEVRAGERVQLELRLKPEPVELDSVVAAAAPGARPTLLDLTGFNDREKLGIGRFITRADIAQRNPRELNDVFRSVPGVRLVPTGTGRLDIVLRGGGMRRGVTRHCYPAVFIDGVRTPAGGHHPTDLNEIVPPGNVEGIEIYLGPSEVPPIFGGTGSVCGAVVVWTRDPRPGRGQPARNDTSQAAPRERPPTTP